MQVHIDVLTLFPEMFSQVLSASILGRAIEQGYLSVNTYNIRDYSADKHHRVDDYAFGGGTGLIMMAQPIFDAINAIDPEHTAKRIYLSPQGRVMNDAKARQLSHENRLLLLCGHYEGIDQRVVETLIDEEVSIGDYVLTGGELPAMVMIDAVARQIKGVLGNENGADDESFANGLLEYPQYTRPSDYNGLPVPEVLLSGHHKNITAWRRKQSVLKTALNRPDLLDKVQLSGDEEKMVKELSALQDTDK